MLRFALLAAPLLIAAAPAKDQRGAVEECPRIGDGLHEVETTPAQKGVQRLDQLPPANHYLTVLKVEGGCVKPVIVKYNVGQTKQP
ncbi:hypothetical protein [Sphingomonas sanxanigenens]|uniref:hypothetical protein n=1 Tax=Sphingomonas sanxanigenens TaxID=397260 RepID=UPI001300D20F|nr:hypothetical protein [Sphingomonas sanxanigenens]